MDALEAFGEALPAACANAKKKTADLRFYQPGSEKKPASSYSAFHLTRDAFDRVVRRQNRTFLPGYEMG
jgi:hypothetical protein